MTLELPPQMTGLNFAAPSIAEAKGGLNICGVPCNPSKERVIREAVQTQGLIRRMADEPAKAASRIELFPQFEHQSEGWTRADPESSTAERLAWLVFRQIADYNGNQKRLVQQIHKVQHTYGHGWGITLQDDDGRNYCKFVPFHTVKATRAKNRDVYEWEYKKGQPPKILDPVNVRYLAVPDDLGHCGDSFSVFSPMVDTIVTWTIVWSALTSAARSSLFSAGLLWAPVDEGNSWVDDWTWLIDQVSKQLTANPAMIAKVLPHPVSSGGDKPEHVSFGETIQTGIITFEKVCREMLASMLTTAPMKQILEGEGTGSQWASTLLLREVLNGYGRPQLEDVVIPTLIDWKFHSALKAVFAANNITMDVRRWSIGTNILKAAIRPEDPGGALAVYKGAGTNREWLITQSGGTAADLLPLPDGITEYDHWRIANASGKLNVEFDADADNEQVGQGNPPSDTENQFSPNERGPKSSDAQAPDQASTDPDDPWMDPLWDAA